VDSFVRVPMVRNYEAVVHSGPIN